MALFDVNWNPDKPMLRKFGLAMIIGFGIIGGIFYWRASVENPVTPLWLWGFGLVTGLIGLSGTKAAIPVYKAWMGFAFAIGQVMSRLLLALVFFGVVTPLGLLGWLVGRDRLQLRRKADAQTYWVPIKPPAEPPDYERQF